MQKTLPNPNPLMQVGPNTQTHPFKTVVPISGVYSLSTKQLIKTE